MSCQDVCIAMDYDGYTEFSSDVKRRAAKPYTCCECGEAIAKGEEHIYTVGKSDGDFWSCRTCLACDETEDAFGCGEWVVGQLWEAIREQLFPKWNDMVAIDCLAKLTTDAAIAKMRARYAQYVEDQS